MANNDVIHLYVWSGDASHARALAAVRYPGIEIREFAHRRLRESNLAARIQLLRAFRGRALVFYFRSLDECQYRQVIEWVHFLHHCDRTVFCDRTGEWQSMRSAGIVRNAPRTAFTLLRDLTTLACWWLYLRLRFWRTSPQPFRAHKDDPEVAYLIPSPADLGASGGAISHIRGFLSGLRQSGKTCRVFAGAPLPQDSFPTETVSAIPRPYFFWQAASLAYNHVFANGVRHRLAAGAPAVFYQRHRRFSIAGALLSRCMRVPLILEYNGPETWIADHWDPTPFRALITLCENISLRSAARIVVVSEALKAELLQRGFTADRIRVNPNGVDANHFSPGCGRETVRTALHLQPEEILVGFVGSFSLWHGIGVLQQAIVRLLRSPQPCRLQFVLIGEGLLQGEMRAFLADDEARGTVIFTGPLPPAKVAGYLDAADILVSPHIPMPDGSRFFGSPTKLFEYMAMGKAIVASRLDQLAEVLTHDESAWLVTPGSVDELAEAILQLALDPVKRERLGRAARSIALENHSWTRNVAVAFNETPGNAPATTTVTRLSISPPPATHKLTRSTGNSG